MCYIISIVITREYSLVFDGLSLPRTYLLLALGATQGMPSRVNEPRVIYGPPAPDFEKVRTLFLDWDDERRLGLSPSSGEWF